VRHTSFCTDFIDHHALYQDFNTLANTGISNTLIIPGWLLNETGGGAETMNYMLPITALPLPVIPIAMEPQHPLNGRLAHYNPEP